MRIFNILSQLCGGCDSNGLTDLLQRQNSAKESEGFNVQSFNYGANDAVAHVIAHRSIVAGAGTSDSYNGIDFYRGGTNNGTSEKLFCIDRDGYWNRAGVLRLGFSRNSEQNNGMVRLSESADEQNQFNNDENRVLLVVDIRGSETLKDWICNAERIHPNRVLMCFCFVMKYK